MGDAATLQRRADGGIAGGDDPWTCQGEIAGSRATSNRHRCIRSPARRHSMQ